MKLKLEDVNKKSVVPVKNWMLLCAKEVETGNNLVLPDNRNATRAAGYNVLEVVKIGEECKKVKVGDFVITKPQTVSLMSFRVADNEHLLVNEDDVSAVLRDI